ncbi:MAG: Peptidase M23 [candidate division CPR2 bacterium GW2011_GWC1_39_9]|uniref:Peptidase M23 n=1 Tax=candidate division CPR2 bacterium GW2011_GWC2_39_10 TaxID=1618345 RepID=A0A0G0PAT5_UNCC2|nr:MAG: Peptidase M23 [candidate division CPR2 bacterium GW2011_GWC2_39_10]KKR34951.1 MAG: Peptidase M23 [candidate division CPR2 bacterium GW2011_GWC1_39_9]
MKKTLGINIILTFFVLSLSFIPVNKVDASYTDDKKSEIDQLQKQIDSLQGSITQKKNDAKTLRDEVYIMDDQIDVVEQQINLLAQRVAATNTAIEETTNKIAETEKEIKAQQSILREYLIELYSNGNTTTLEMIASSNSFSEYLNKMEYVEAIQEKVNDNLNKIKILKTEMENKKIQLKRDKETLESLKAEQDQKKKVLDIQRQNKQVLLDQTRGLESVYQNQLASARQKQAEAWAAYESAIASATGNYASSYQGGSGNGYLKWPSAGILTQGYGCTSFAECGNKNGPYGGNIHNGIDISMGYPGPIKAAADGAVLDIGRSFNSQGWGNWVALKHPNGLVTFYSHLSGFAVSAGQAVAQGQTIGYEGSTGFSTGSHLHFSVWTEFVLYNEPNYHGPKYSGTTNPFTFL